MKTRTLATLATLACLALSCSVEPPKDYTNVKADIRCAAVMIVVEHNQNSLRAEQKYKGKVVEVWANLELVTDGFLQLRINPNWKVNCWLPLVSKADLMALETGDLVSVRGRFEGIGFGSVILKDCVLPRQESREDFEAQLYADLGVDPPEPKTEREIAETEEAVAFRGNAADLFSLFDEKGRIVLTHSIGRMIEVSGILERRKTGAIALIIETGQSIVCDMNLETEEKLLALEMKSTVTVRGRVRDIQSKGLILEDGFLVEPGGAPIALSLESGW